MPVSLRFDLSRTGTARDEGLLHSDKALAVHHVEMGDCLPEPSPRQLGSEDDGESNSNPHGLEAVMVFDVRSVLPATIYRMLDGGTKSGKYQSSQQRLRPEENASLSLQEEPQQSPVVVKEHSGIAFASHGTDTTQRGD